MIDAAKELCLNMADKAYYLFEVASFAWEKGMLMRIWEAPQALEVDLSQRLVINQIDYGDCNKAIITVNDKTFTVHKGQTNNVNLNLSKGTTVRVRTLGVRGDSLSVTDVKMGIVAKDRFSSATFVKSNEASLDMKVELLDSAAAATAKGFGVADLPAMSVPADAAGEVLDKIHFTHAPFALLVINDARIVRVNREDRTIEGLKTGDHLSLRTFKALDDGNVEMTTQPLGGFAKTFPAECRFEEEAADPTTLTLTALDDFTARGCVADDVNKFFPNQAVVNDAIRRAIFQTLPDGISVVKFGAQTFKVNPESGFESLPELFDELNGLLDLAFEVITPDKDSSSHPEVGVSVRNAKFAYEMKLFDGAPIRSGAEINRTSTSAMSKDDFVALGFTADEYEANCPAPEPASPPSSTASAEPTGGSPALKFAGIDTSGRATSHASPGSPIFSFAGRIDGSAASSSPTGAVSDGSAGPLVALAERVHSSNPGFAPGRVLAAINIDPRFALARIIAAKEQRAEADGGHM